MTQAPPGAWGDAAPTLRRVGPGVRPGADVASAPMAADSAFGVALVSLWHESAQAGGSVGFDASAERAEIARAAVPIVESLRQGRALGVAADQARRLVGAAVLRPGRGTRSRTGTIEVLVVEPALTGCGLGGRLLGELLTAARDRGLQRVDVAFAQDERGQRFFEKAGFAVWGRRPHWQQGPDGDRDELIMGVQL